MINEEFMVTFGVEIEAIMGFHEDLLRGHLFDTRRDTTIIKSIPVAAREDMVQVNCRYRPQYPKYLGWGLTSRTGYSEEGRRQKQYEDCLAKYGYRGYAGEILTLTKTLLPGNVHVHDDWNKKFSDYSVWHLTHDNSLVGVTKDVLQDHLEQHTSHRVENVDNWDSHPIELVSRILPFEPSSFEELNQHLSGLFTSPNNAHTALTNSSCGLHVHIGLPQPPTHNPNTPPQTFTLPTLQHLAYILVMYELEISKLFPASRRSGSKASKTDLRTNLDNFIPEHTFSDNDDDGGMDFEPMEAEREAAEAAGVDLSQPFDDEPSCPTIPFPEARAKIFTPDMTLPDLMNLMSGDSRTATADANRGRIVNFLSILKTGTVEFRQHEGTLDEADIRCWVTFIVGLVRLAEWNSRSYGVGRWEDDDEVWRPYAGEGYIRREWDVEIEVADLVRGMGMEEGEVGEWVTERGERFRGEVIEEGDQ